MKLDKFCHLPNGYYKLSYTLIEMAVKGEEYALPD
jgi:hypothetical protein